MGKILNSIIREFMNAMNLLSSCFKTRELSKSERELKLEFAKLLIETGSIFTIVSAVLRASGWKLFIFLLGLMILSGMFYIAGLLFTKESPPWLFSFLFAATFSALLSIMLSLPFSLIYFAIYYIILTTTLFVMLAGKPKAYRTLPNEFRSQINGLEPHENSQARK